MGIDTGLDQLADQLARESEAYAGHLTHREASFLALLAACAPGDGVLLEVGSFKGKSTVILAKAEAAARGRSSVVSVDPLTSPAPTDPSLDGAASCRDEFFGNLERAGVKEMVEFHETTSQELVKQWDRPLRALWIDGDHTLEGATSDFELFWSFLAPGGVIAFHDVMHCSGPTRVFADRVLRSDLFGATGIVGSIGWAQRRGESGRDDHADHRQRLARKLDRHTRVSERSDSRSNEALAKILRSRVPHSSLTAAEFCAQLGVRVPALQPSAVG